MTASLIEFHSCERVPYAARTIIGQIKLILLVYYVDEHLLKLNIGDRNSILPVILASNLK